MWTECSKGNYAACERWLIDYLLSITLPALDSRALQRGPSSTLPATQTHQENIMNILNRPEQAYAPVDQPTNFPCFYLIPDTTTAPIQRPACNDPTFHQCSPTRIKPPQETRLQKYLRQEMEIFQEVCADARAAITQAARDAVHFLARWVILPLSVASMFWIPIANPAALPL